ncbi:hypothetical protein D3C87_1468540 [compost metagenome]
MIRPFGAQNRQLQVRIDLQQGLGRDLGLGAVHRVGEGEDLAVQVGDLERVQIGDGDATDSGADQHLHAGAAHAADAGDEDGAVLQPSLFLFADEAQVAGGHLGIEVFGHRASFQGLRTPHGRLAESQ